MIADKPYWTELMDRKTLITLAYYRMTPEQAMEHQLLNWFRGMSVVQILVAVNLHCKQLSTLDISIFMPVMKPEKLWIWCFCKHSAHTLAFTLLETTQTHFTKEIE